ncbi:TetR/AcrR family transcriptional regulator [Acinetobacter gyllenbergii]|uniref:TetR/AcrR family transcriptional regulator n=1 Tax=Acinetobacter gyllenbergii TaxID=134534 RepID=UPI0021D08855|nr:TetR/AcrR family transcriptional regulator [Acinetobacter gyllenbergii]MCU4580931.1 TetR/AcrR family transcriptional regulator [Acinetobacter gyllenbergii]
MPPFALTYRALKVLDTSQALFSQDGFHQVGVDLIIDASQIAKGTFYKYFHSKEHLVEMTLSLQRTALKKEVRSILYANKNLSGRERLKRIFFLHADLEGMYHLLFRAVFEIKARYPNAYEMVVEYRNWLIREIYMLLARTDIHAAKADAQMFLFVVDGAMVQLLSGHKVDKGKLLDGWLVGWGSKFINSGYG